MNSDTNLNNNLPSYERKDTSPTEVHLEIVIPSDQFATEYKKQLETLSKDVAVKGFRKGKAPLDMVESAKGREALENVLRNLMPLLTIQVLQKETLQPVIPVSYRVLNIEDKDSVKFDATVTLIPEIKLPDVKKIKVEKEKTEVDDKEIESVLKRLWQDHKGEFKDKDDKWVESISGKLGFKSKTLKELEEELRVAIKGEKERISEQKYSVDVLKKAIEMAKVEVPEAAVHFEMEERERSFEHQLEEMKISVEQFCNIRGTTLDELRSQWHKDSHDALENDVFLSKYSQERNIEVTQEDLDEEIALMKSRAKEGEDNTAMFNDPQWKSYMSRILLKRKAFKTFLDEVEGKDPLKSDKDKKSK